MWQFLFLVLQFAAYELGDQVIHSGWIFAPCCPHDSLFIDYVQTVETLAMADLSSLGQLGYHGGFHSLQEQPQATWVPTHLFFFNLESTQTQKLPLLLCKRTYKPIFLGPQF